MSPNFHFHDQNLSNLEQLNKKEKSQLLGNARWGERVNNSLRL